MGALASACLLLSPLCLLSAHLPSLPVNLDWPVNDKAGMVTCLRSAQVCTRPAPVYKNPNQLRLDQGGPWCSALRLPSPPTKGRGNPRNAEPSPIFHPERTSQTTGLREGPGDDSLQNLQPRVEVRQGLTERDNAVVLQAVNANVQTPQGFIFVQSRSHIGTAGRGQGTVRARAGKHA